MTALPHYRHLASSARTAAVIEFSEWLLGLFIRLWRWMLPAFDSTRIPRHDLDAVHPGATPAYAEVLHEQNTPTEPLAPLTDTAWWRGGELAIGDA